ncbi:MAG: hypothetical protein AAGF11_48045 [Myxococcota bacterium]
MTLHGGEREVIDGAQVRLCFDGPRPERLVAVGTVSGYGLVDVHSASGVALSHDDGVIDLSVMGDDHCLDYAVDFSALAEAVREGDWWRAFRVRDTGMLVTRPAMWLWRPPRYLASAKIELEIRRPAHTEFSASWTPSPASDGAEVEHFILDSTLYRWLGYVAMGDFVAERFEHQGAQVELLRPHLQVSVSDEGWRGWIEDAIDSVTMLYGAFPRSRLQVLTLPVVGHDDPVLGGTACRGGGSGVMLIFDANAEDDQLPGHWVTVHELLHHGMPFVDGTWMSEGFVTYYTTVLRTRRGQRSEQRGWSALIDGFTRGQDHEVPASLREASERINELGAYHRVYWGGAAVAFLLDVALRVDSEGERSLDDAMRELRRCCDSRERPSARSLLEHLDRWYGKPLFTSTALPLLDSAEFPDVESALERLGVEADGSFDPEHPGAAMRRAIMAPREPTERSATGIVSLSSKAELRAE